MIELSLSRAAMSGTGHGSGHSGPGGRPSLRGWILPVLRLAWRDAANTVWSKIYWILLLAPLLLTALVSLLVISVTILLVVVEVSASDETASPLGADRIAVVLDAIPLESRSQIDALVETLGNRAPEPPREARLGVRFVEFLQEAGAAGVSKAIRSNPNQHESLSAPSAPASDRGAPAVSIGAEERSAAPEGSYLPGAETAASPDSGEAGLAVEVLEGAVWGDVAAQVPTRYDAVVRFGRSADGHLRYQLAHDPGLLYSRVMIHRIETQIERFNQEHVGAQAASGGQFSIEEHREGSADPWMVQLVLVLSSFGLAFLYYSVGAQATAGVLAGERESRTLEVLLSLPLTHRQILYGKALGLVGATAIPTLLWSGASWVGASLVFGLEVPMIPLAWVLVSLLLALLSVGCAVSASSPTTASARSRMGLVNLGSLGGGGILTLLFPRVWPEDWLPLRALLGLEGAEWVPWAAAGLLSGALVTVALVILELGLRGFRRLG